MMEHAKDGMAIPAYIGWDGCGSWQLGRLLSPDQDGNIFVDPYIEIDAHNTLVFGGKRLVATIGSKDMVIADSENALLICAKKREQEISRNRKTAEDKWR